MTELNNDDVAVLGAAARVLWASDLQNYRSTQVDAADHRLVVGATEGDPMVLEEIRYVAKQALEAFNQAAGWISQANIRGDWSPRRAPWEER